MKKLSLNKLFLICFVPVFAVLAVYNIVTPSKRFSENENRYLASFPTFSVDSLLAGKYTRSIDDYLSDQFVFRDSWIAVQSSSERLLGKRELNGVFVAGNRLIGDIKQPYADIVQSNIDGINTFCAAHPNMRAYLMVVPSASYIQRCDLPLFAPSRNQNSWIESVYSRLNGATGINVCESLQTNADRYIYYRTDHHWTTFGAYLAYGEYCAAAGLNAKPLRLEYVCDGFNGTLFSSSGVRTVEPDLLFAYYPDNVSGFSVFDGEKTTEYDGIYFEEFLSKKDKYSYFLGSNQTVVTIHTSAGTGQSLLIFKDSYAHCFAPMLCGSYDTITLVDLRYIVGSVGEIVQLEQYDEVLFLYSSDVFAHQRNSALLSVG